ncbi:protein of unknown function [Fontimonas thermophila]|uniref:DUF4340 domain-containing protein n=1 Tax=Fontimonas thermophila TaxID=1076937 RepID=A0A1I2H650_9GAMM|nr:DUF4340 domain-containing protein [Fontimonas thermophila]SFF25038.1 protein of unknown function [Fontimonas thermophila]
MKRVHLNLALAVVVVGLALAAWLGRAKPETLPPLTPLAENDLKTITIAHPDAPVIKLEKQDGEWRLVEPVKAPTDPFEVSSLVGLAKLEVKRSLPLTEVSLAELKLDPPRYTVTLNDQVLAFGDSEPLEYRRYIKTGDRVALVSDPPSAALDADYSDLVAKELLPKNAEIRRIEVPGLTVRRSDDGASWVAEGQADVAAERLQRFVDAWKNARAMWNARRPSDAGDSGEVVKLTLADGDVLLRIVARDPQLQIDRPDYGVRYTLSKTDVDKLLKLPDPPPAPAASESKPQAESEKKD